jgi:hypothetical protein
MGRAKGQRVLSAVVFAARWWDTSGGGPSMTNGQVVRVETMFDQYTAGATKTDADGTAVPISLTTRTITGDPEAQKLFQRATVRHQQSSTTAAVTVTAQSKLDAADISAASVRALGSLSNTNVLTVTNATNANPIVGARLGAGREPDPGAQGGLRPGDGRRPPSWLLSTSIAGRLRDCSRLAVGSAGGSDI